MKEKTTLEEAKAIAEKIKKKYNFGKSSCPSWFKNVCTPMEQDGSFGVSICIPSWYEVPQNEADALFELFDGIHITMRVVSSGFKKVDEEKNEQTKERSSNRKSNR